MFGSLGLRTKKPHLECKHFKQNNNFAMFLWSTGQVGNCFFLWNFGGERFSLLELGFVGEFKLEVTGNLPDLGTESHGKSTDFPVFEFLKSDFFCFCGDLYQSI